MDRANVEGVRVSSDNLKDGVIRARAAREAQIEEIAKPLREIAESPDVAQKEVAEGVAQAAARLKSDELFSIAVVGRMKVGKSTLLNALLGPSDSVTEAPLPVEDLPCTATLIKLRYSDDPYCRPYVWDKSRNAIGAALPDWDFREFHQKARIYQQGNETNIFDNIAEFEVGWPSALLRAGITLIDTPGISEAPERTELTRAAIAKVDAAVVAYRTEPWPVPTKSRLRKKSPRKAGKVFTLVNMRGDHRMPPSPALENVVRSRLSLSPKFDLEKQDVYFAHFRDGLKAKYQRDLELSKASGLAAFEACLASFLISDRYNAYVLKVIREIKPLAASLSGSIASVKAAALSEETSSDRRLSIAGKTLR